MRGRERKGQPQVFSFHSPRFTFALSFKIEEFPLGTIKEKERGANYVIRI